MRQPNMTLAGLLAYDDTVLDTLRLPDALEGDREVINDNLVLDTQGLEVVYTSPEFMKAAIGSWSRKMLPVWTELEATLHYEYDPIANYDRIEHWSDTRNVDQDTTGQTTHGHQIAGTDSLAYGHEVDTTNSLTHGEAVSTTGSMVHGEKVDTTSRDNFGHTITTNGTNDQTTSGDTTGWNSNTYNALDRQTIDQDTTGSETHGGQDTSTGSETHSGTDSSSGSETHSGTDSGTGSETHSGTDARTTSETHSGTDREQGTLDVEETNVRDGYARGNIGVTTTQQMIEAQREVVLFNMIDTIVNDFKKRFCLMVY